jgi:GNAT superfamily N-acetyltransferase
MQALEALSLSAQLKDQASPPLYWNLIREQRATNGDLLYMKENEGLAGYMGYFLFENGLAEITAVVDPLYRNQGIFSELFDYASMELRKLGVESIQFRAPAHVTDTRHTLEAIGANYSHSEYELRCEHLLADFRISGIKLVEGTEDLIEEITALHRLNELPFEDQLLVKAHFQSVLKTKNRHCVIGYYHHKPVGILHAHIGEDINLHDFSFVKERPTAQLKFQFFNLALQHFIKIAHKPINIVLKEHQWMCLDQFLRQGFKIDDITEYWKIPLADHNRTVRKTKKLVN